MGLVKLSILFFYSLFILGCSSSSWVYSYKADNSQVYPPLSQYVLPLIDEKYILDDCYIIPNSTNRLCAYFYKEGAMGFVEMKYFVLSLDGTNQETLNDEGTGHSFCGISFSENGRLLGLCFADEGHPAFGFFETNTFINTNNAPLIGNVLEDYYFGKIEHFSDNGVIFYSVMDMNSDADEQSPPCLHRFNIYSSKDSALFYYKRG